MDEKAQKPPPPRLIAWEVTRRCILNCRHCRGASLDREYSEDLTTDECRKFIEALAGYAKPILIFTGGEPLLRADIFDLIELAVSKGLRCALATCGGPVTEEMAARIRDSGIARVSISIDGATSETHDEFRGQEGAFDKALGAAANLRKAGVGFQINTTLTTHNLSELPGILELAKSLGAASFDVFLLVPTGRARDLVDQEISPSDYEKTLHWIADIRNDAGLTVRTTCAPHYHRILSQRGESKGARHGLDAETRGCLGGKAFAFVSHKGVVQICGFLEIPAGNLRDHGFDFRKIWENSDFLDSIRDVNGYRGKCGICNYRRLCGGCRARAHAITGDYLAEEPFCTYIPPEVKD
jgi:heme b synthase